MFKPATAAAVLIALSMPAHAAGDFPMRQCKRLSLAKQSLLPTGTSRMFMIPTKIRSATSGCSGR